MSTGASARASAARAVAHVLAGQSLDQALAGNRTDGSPADVSLARLLAYETLRWYFRMEPLLTRFAARPESLHPTVRALALVGFTQIFQIDMPAYAAVSATVDATRLVGQPKAAGLMNAILRRAQREGPALLRELDRDPSRRHSHPAWLVSRLRVDLPEVWENILRANNEHPPFWLRVNRRRSTRDAYIERLTQAGLDFETSEIAPDAVRLIEAMDLQCLPGFETGDVSVQDAAAQLAVDFIEPQPHERVLDACAAPGGKTCHLLERAPALTEVVAVDVNAARIERVRENLERLDLKATLICGDVAEPSTWWEGRPFDRILLDVPCSATGVIRRHPDIKVLRRDSDIAELAARQARLLNSMWPLLAPGGRLVYASCSALRAENAAVVGAFLERTSDARDVTQIYADRLGLTQRSRVGLAITAGTAGMDGFYYACLDKT